MHMQLFHDNKVIIFDRTDFGPSNLSLANGRCRRDPEDLVLQTDCTAHSVLYNPINNTFRPLFLQTDTWCSSGALLSDGTLLQTGGFNDGENVTRMFRSCDTAACDWEEIPGYLTRPRWYATNQILPDGRIIIIGGRREFNYEFYPQKTKQLHRFNFLRATRDGAENNLYPFVHLLPDGNLFIFANTRSILFDYKQNKVVREFPVIPGGDPRNYPSSGSSVLLPLNDNKPTEAEVMVCGGAPPGAFSQARRGVFVQAISTCGRLKVTDQNPNWVMENMPMGRVMSDMLLLPDGNVIIINGALSGVSGWDLGRDPIMRPIIYRPSGPKTRRFLIMKASKTPRMYHSSAVLLADGRVLVGGSNPHQFYNFTGVLFPTDLSVEAFSPQYLSADNDATRPRINSMHNALAYNKTFDVTFRVSNFVNASVVSVSLIAPSFTTHSFAMNQRMVVLKVYRVLKVNDDTYEAKVVGPSTPEIVPPGDYMMFVVHALIPSSATWVNIHL